MADLNLGGYRAIMDQVSHQHGSALADRSE
jgi:hypothetical protein